MKLFSYSILIVLFLFISCSENKTEPPFEIEISLHIKAATMREAALQFSEQVGVEFKLSEDFKPDEILRDEFFLYFPAAKLKDHIEELKGMYIVNIRWEEDHFTIYDVPIK